MWNILNSLLNKYRDKSGVGSLLVDGVKINSNVDICESFSNFFGTAGANVQKNIPNCSTDPLSYLTSQNAKLSEISTSDLEVEKIINNMKDKSSYGFDGLSNKMLKQLVTSIRGPLSYICNLSFRTSVFPDRMKIAKVIPLFKGGDKTLCENYRPISLLPVLSKIIEKIVYVRVVNHLEENNILYSKQFGFRRDHSTNDAINTFVNDILRSNEAGLDVLAVFIDLKKAFDTCSHTTILNKLRKCGIDDTLLEWFRNYFRGRRQLVTVNGEISANHDVTLGVPQGSLLGVLCFQLIINDLHKSLKWSSAILYADDTTIYVVGSNLKFLVQKINADLASLSQWLQANKLSLNTKKTKFMLFSKNIYHGDIHVCIDSTPIEMVNEFKFLGFILDSKLSCEPHIDMLLSKLIGVDYCIRKISDFVPKKCLRTLYYSFFHSNFTYGLSVWGSLLCQSRIDKMCKLQKKVIRHVDKKLDTSHCQPIFKHLNILKLNDLVTLENLKLLYRVKHKYAPPPVIRIFQTSGGKSSRNNNLIVPKHSSKRLNKSFVVRAIVQWNQLSYKIKNASSMYSFVTQLKKFLFEKY